VNWAGKPTENKRVYANRRRGGAEYGKSLFGAAAEVWSGAQLRALLRGRAGMAACHLRGRENIRETAYWSSGVVQPEPESEENFWWSGHPRELRKPLWQVVFRNSSRFLLGSAGKAVRGSPLHSPAAGRGWNDRPLAE